MKFRKGQTILKVPPMGALEGATLQLAGMQVMIAVTHMDDLIKMRKKYPPEKAWPMYCALALGAHEVHLWPTPHKGGAIKLRYYPPMEEI